MKHFISFLTVVTLGMTLTGCASKKQPDIDSAASNRTPVAEGAILPSSDIAAEQTAAARANDGVTTIKRNRFFGIFSPYRVNIQQGNFVSKEMISQLKIGMSREQVSYALGTPLLADMFHNNRWDYAFRLLKRDGELTTSNVTVYFTDNLLSKIEGGDLPNEADYLNRLSGGIEEAKKQADDNEPTDDKPSGSAAPSSSGR